MKWLRLLALIVIGFFLVVPMAVSADVPTADIVITAQGVVVAAPGNFTLTYISDYDIGISWTKPVGAVNTMVRAAFNRVPTSISDGYQVYYGAGVSTNDTAVSLGTPDVVYYRAWSQTALGAWGPLWASGDTSRFMSASFLFIGFILIACFLTWFSARRPEILISLAAGTTWLALGFWVLISGTSNLSLTSPWTVMLAWVFVAMTFVPFLMQMNVEIKREYKGQRWVEHGQKPKVGLNSYEAYKNDLHRRLRGR